MGSPARRAMDGVLRPPLDGRQAKPRRRGLTMVIDKGLGVGETGDLLDLGADYLDIIKISFGTAVLYPDRTLRAKVRVIRSHRLMVCPGGTLLEIAVLQDRLRPFLAGVARLGMDAVEISDGTIDMTPAQRGAAIRAAHEIGLTVITEVGKKDPERPLSPAATADRIRFDLEHGARLVILEARESGRGVGIFAPDGSVKEDELEAILAGLHDQDAVMWEAPLKDQQARLIRRLGPNVNLGNVAPSDVLALEALRRGLRADTLRSIRPGAVPSPAERDREGSSVAESGQGSSVAESGRGNTG